MHRQWSKTLFQCARNANDMLRQLPCLRAVGNVSDQHASSGTHDAEHFSDNRKTLSKGRKIDEDMMAESTVEVIVRKRQVFSIPGFELRIQNPKPARNRQRIV